VHPTIRAFDDRDRDAVLALSLRAWAPVFASLEAILGESGVFARLHPDWRADQRRAVGATLDGERIRVWVAERDAMVAGFVAVQVDRQAGIGEISMLAVDPDHQRHGIGSLLTSFALDRIRDSGMTVAMVDTGGDPGHAPARRIYEKAGFTPLPVVRYFRKLDPGSTPDH
jgi:ribosomal protein S18 acetylase RimI-like enzyme